MATHSSVLAWKNPTDRGAWRVKVAKIQRAAKFQGAAKIQGVLKIQAFLKGGPKRSLRQVTK